MSPLGKSKTKVPSFLHNLFASPKRKRAAFFILTTVFVLGFSFPNFCFAYNPTAQERTELKNLFKINDAQLDAYIQKYSGDANFVTLKVDISKEFPSGDPTADSLNSFSATSIVSAVGAGLMKIVLAVVIGVLAVIAFFCKYLLMFAGWTLDATLNPNLYNFTNNEMITNGWIIVRDVCNLFFLLVLVFIAICTILKIERYHAKKTLLMLIIIALLINFSKPIAIFIFDGSQLLMNFFLKQFISVNGQSPSTQLASGIAEFIYDNLKAQLQNAGTTPEVAVYYLFVVVFLFLFAIALFVTAIFLVIRIIAVMVLIIVSPLAFFASVIPDFSKLASSWWSALFNYCYYGPAAAFFLLLAAKFATSNVLPKLNVQGNNMVAQNIIQYLTVLVFLFASIIMSKQFSLFAAQAVTSNAGKFAKWAGGMTKTGGMWGAAGRMAGVTGATSQRLQQSKYLRWMTKQGRADAQEEMEARVGEKIGVKGAKARQVQKRAKKYKDEHYSEAALRDMVNKGDEAAGYRLAEDGDMNEADYARLAAKFKGKDDPVKKLIDGKLKDKRMDVLVNYRINTEATTGGVVNPVMAGQIAEEELGKLSPSKWKDQNTEKLFGFDPIAGTYTTDALSEARRNAARNIYANFHPKNRDKVIDDMPGSKFAAGHNAAMPGGSIW